MSDALRLPLYLLVSGDAFFLGLALTAASVVIGRQWPRVTSRLLWSGLALTILSATPVHPAGYVLLLVSVVAWRLALSRNSRLRRATSAGVLVVVCGLCGAELLDRGFFKPTIDASRHLVIIGDSLSAGLGATREGTWPSLLAQRHDLGITNLARAGATLADGQSQIKGIPPGPVTVLVELGGNDVLDSVGPERFAVDLRALLAAAATKERRVLMFELPLLPLQDAYGRVQRRLCHAYGVRLLPRSVLAGAVALPGHTTDGLHLSPAGHAWLAARVRAAFSWEDADKGSDKRRDR
jgi:acyl-CoA thioesterase-1